MKTLGYLIFPLLGLLFIGISLPFIYGKVPPNRWSGLRIPKTLSDSEIWYAANRVMGFDLLIAGIVILVVSIIVVMLGRTYPSLPTTRINLAVLLISLAFVAIHSFWTVSRM